MAKGGARQIALLTSCLERATVPQRPRRWQPPPHPRPAPTSFHVVGEGLAPPVEPRLAPPGFLASRGPARMGVNGWQRNGRGGVAYPLNTVLFTGHYTSCSLL